MKRIPCFFFYDFTERKIYQEIGDHLTAAVNFTINQLPEVLTECTLVYIPEMGHLLVTKKNDRLTEPNQLEHLGFQFMVFLHPEISLVYLFLL